MDSEGGCLVASLGSAQGFEVTRCLPSGVYIVTFELHKDKGVDELLQTGLGTLGFALSYITCTKERMPKAWVNTAF